MKRILILFPVLLYSMSTIINGAETVDTSFVVNNVKRGLLISVPTDYNNTNKYSLIVALQPCMGDAKSYRDGFKQVSDSLKTIVVCPNVSQQWIADNQWNIVTTCIDSAKAMYNIDTTKVYLTGMSCNGDYALRNGLKKLYPFKGIFPWAPYTLNADPKKINFNSNMPITLAIGMKDEYAYTSIQDIYDSLNSHGAKAFLVLIPGINHIYSFPDFANVMIRSINYINDTGQITLQKLDTDYFEIMDTVSAKVLSFKISDKLSKDLVVSAISSNPGIIPDPEIIYTPEDSTVKLTLRPIAGKTGKVRIIFETKEKNGTAIMQSVIKFNIKKFVDISEVKENSNFSVYPNPAKNKLFIQTRESFISYQIIDITGTIIKKDNLITNQSIDISGLIKGIYFLKLSGYNSNSTNKFIVE
jgi:hypothetical protein